MDVDGAHWVPLNKRGSQADTGLVRKQILEESSSLASPGKTGRGKVLRGVGCWEAEPGEIPLAGGQPS